MSGDQSRLILLTSESLKFFDASTGKVLDERKSKALPRVWRETSVAVSPDGRFVTGKISEEKFVIYDSIEEKIETFNLLEAVALSSISSDSEWAVILVVDYPETYLENNQNGRFELWNLPQKRKILDLALPPGVKHFQFLKDPKMLLVLDSNSRIRIIDLSEVILQHNLDHRGSP
jgi:hypothetical protein